MASSSDEVLHLPPEVLKLTHQLEQEKYESLARRYEVLRKENELLKARLEKSEKDTHEFVAYFERELEAKDLRIDALTEEREKMDDDFRRETASLKHKHKAAYEAVAAALQETETSSSQQVNLLEDELAKVDSFREMKQAMDLKMQGLEDEVRRLKEELDLESSANERKMMVEKAKMAKDLDRRTAEVRRVAKAEMQKGLDADTLKVISDNRRMGEELRFQQQVSAELAAEKRRVDEEVKVFRRELDLAKQAEAEYAKQANARHKECRKLEDRVTALDDLLKESASKFVAERDALRLGLEADLDERTLDAGALRQMLRLKDKELKQIRRLAETVLRQRTDVEHYFLEALEDVKRQIRDQRADQYRTEMIDYRQKMREATTENSSFPKIRSLQAGRNMDEFGDSQPPPPLAPNARVQLRDLTLQDREHVLRLLFAKINAVQSTAAAMPQPNHFEGSSTFVTTAQPPPSAGEGLARTR